MRTTLQIDNEILAEARRLADRTGRTLSAIIIEEALREMLTRRQLQTVERPWVRLTTVSGWGLLPGVNLDNSASLLDLMDSLDAADGR